MIGVTILTAAGLVSDPPPSNPGFWESDTPAAASCLNTCTVPSCLASGLVRGYICLQHCDRHVSFLFSSCTHVCRRFAGRIPDTG
ncbi:hypothetical protein P154DRAFT_187092 [Amniculicola lignicola CBS 123094]|uniref:Uncharacterized protein n=1 Tax=Amniculicola lignicola CBS 123094 TaxID=1392246 RepID=A0A6A5WGM1_9PLEO|nr:hypothetical protein P154DRAFT_187092 [Amniculicola lignicola CBS 123094]